MRIRLSLLPWALVLPLLQAQDLPIDTERSAITIHVGRAGLLSAAGHDHWVNAPVSSGMVRETGAPHVEFKVESAKLTVKPDPKLDAKTQVTIQKDMEEMTLETKKYPEISFQSSSVQASSDGNKWMVEGTLTLHGETQPVSVAVTRDGGAYTGHTVLKQTDFRIKPVSVGGGMVKIKNEIDIDFQIYARSAR
jgi:polyisoprenoid-binding protein YceI